MNLSSLKPDEVEGILESPLDILFSAFQLLSLIYLEKHPSPTEEEFFALVTEALFLNPRSRKWMMRMNTFTSQAEMDEIKKRREVLQKQSEELDAYWGTGQRLPDRLQLYGEVFAIGLRMATCPWVVRIRAKLLKKMGKKQARAAKAGRQRNNRKAAKRLYDRFREDEKARQNYGRIPSQAYADAVKEAALSLQADLRVKDKQEVFRIFKELLSTPPRP